MNRPLSAAGLALAWAMTQNKQYVRLGALHPLGHMGEIADAVDAILYLESAGFVTGEILHVGGDQSAGH